MSICTGEDADEIGENCSKYNFYADFASAILRFFMGLIITCFLWYTRKKRQFPRFVILQLVLIDVEYLISIVMNMWTFYRLKKYGLEAKDDPGHELYVAIHYPTEQLI